MLFKKRKDEDSPFKGVMLAYFILVLHVLLFAGIGLMVIFFRGIINYMLWILIGGGVIIIAVAYYIYRRMKEEGKTLKETLSSPMFSGRPVEVSVLGGLASFKIGRPSNIPTLGYDQSKQFLQLEDSSTMRIRELTELANLFENNLISQDEYNIAKQQVFKSFNSANS
ncbi:MAG: SHOCT domain-containing protein [Desulfobacterales bacterium]|nr:SHOCT domain-containing protein [Desulfobacterales bacterium]